MKAYHEYIVSEGTPLFTGICLPEAEGKFPVVIYRSPYVDDNEALTDEDAVNRIYEENKYWVDAGYAVVYQHCRGAGKSKGDCIPYIYEREDGLNLHQWVREQDFYNGEIYLHGISYTAAVHYVTAPFAPDIKGMVLEVKETERYNCNYRNGFYKMALHGGWFVNMYKRNQHVTKYFAPESYNTLPLIDFSEIVFGEKCEAFDQILLHPEKDDPFWNTRFGGVEARDAIMNANIPILLTTGFYDVFLDGMFQMWKKLDPETKAKSAFVVDPYDHGRRPEGQPICHPGGVMAEHFQDYVLNWVEAIRGKREFQFELGKVTYYKLYGDEWCCDEWKQPEKFVDVPIGKGWGERTYRYNPYAPPTFRGALTQGFGGTAHQDPPNFRSDILNYYTDEFTEDIFVKGKMSAKVRVKSDCEDTCFYMRISLHTPTGDYGLRDDITKISNFDPDYVPGTPIDITFDFDDVATLVRKGWRIRVDISSADFPHFVRHTNLKGPYALQTGCKVANNTVDFDNFVLRYYYE